MNKSIKKKRKINYFRLGIVLLSAAILIFGIIYLIYTLERGNVINVLPEMHVGSETKESEQIGGILIDDIHGLSDEDWERLQEYLNSKYYSQDDFRDFIESLGGSVSPYENNIEPSSENIKKLIEVSYQEQKLYYYENDELVFTSDVVTGNETTDIIPYGTYHVLHMAKDATLVGADYEKHVDYWIGFDNETGGHMVGFHDASWRTVFGGDEWKTNPTLECVNMPTDKVKQLFEAVDLGTEIRIHD